MRTWSLPGFRKWHRQCSFNPKMFFQSKNHLEAVLQNDNYPDLLEHFLASLSTWNNTFGSTLTDTHEPLKDSLLIELYHLKACIGSISIQAVVKRTTVSGSVRPHQDGLASYMTVQDAKFLQGVLS
ncbi:ARO80-positive transcription regulator of ARO9 and ARO10, partial [Colletotrichum asianum]